MELSILYGGGNAELLTKMVDNIFMQQPNYTSDVKLVVPTVLEVFEKVLEKCGLKTDSPKKGPTQLTDSRQGGYVVSMWWYDD
ncbi:Activating signal cointegrator 1 complex subunit 2 [Holothuria leucospilota]|uniref:Activating signal cointegrator 1 complex subunit 2 n=1 Tax=Holothuria leucospilota TaxID=206669 RepID=A0A9Q1BBA9_HOLLE|nr:Activating signal cointegrator 1 complex subunit 2 [Holothuria leucospilota]